MTQSNYYASLALVIGAAACGSGPEPGAMMPPVCCDADAADATRVEIDGADGGGAPNDDVSRDADPPLDIGLSDGPPNDDVSRDTDAPLDGRLSDGPPTDVPVEDPACPLRDPDPLVCADPDAGLSATRWVHCTRTGRNVASANWPNVFQMDAQGIYWAAGFGEIYMLPNGATSPTLIVSVRAVNSFRGFRLDDSAIYFDDETDGGQFVITSIKRDRTGRMALVTSGSGTLAIDHDRIYFGNGSGQLAWLPKGGGTPVVTSIPTPEPRLYLLDDTHLYWFEGAASDRTLKRLAKSGTTVETVADHQGPVSWLIQDTTHLYWLTGADYTTRGIRRIAKNGTTTVETLTSNLENVSVFTEQGDGLLLVARGRIVEVPKTGGCPRVLVTPPAMYRIGWPVADGGSIYWQAPYGNKTFTFSLWRAPRTGGVAAQLIAPTNLGAEPGETHLTPTQIWWTTSTSISVMERR